MSTSTAKFGTMPLGSFYLMRIFSISLEERQHFSIMGILWLIATSEITGNSEITGGPSRWGMAPVCSFSLELFFPCPRKQVSQGAMGKKTFKTNVIAVRTAILNRTALGM